METASNEVHDLKESSHVMALGAPLATTALSSLPLHAAPPLRHCYPMHAFLLPLVMEQGAQVCPRVFGCFLNVLERGQCNFKAHSGEKQVG